MYVLQVNVCVERQGGLMVAGVRVWHVDLLSALASLQHLVSSAGQSVTRLFTLMPLLINSVTQLTQHTNESI